MKWIFALVAVLAFVVPALTHAAEVDFTSDPVRVYLVTFGPGSDPWEKFGHDFIVVEDFSQPMPWSPEWDPNHVLHFDHYEMAFNWGVFDFGDGSLKGTFIFGWHFVQGKLLYKMDGWPEPFNVAEASHEQRTMSLQELHLTSVQKFDLIRRLNANNTDANRYYRYDYFLKNCSTMARDAIDKTVNGQVEKTLSKIPTDTTYRWHDRRLTADTLWLYFFLDYALGHGVDRPLNAWEESFLPEKLADHLQHVMVPGPDGKLIPLAGEPEVLNTGIYVERSTAPNYFWGFLATGVGIAAMFAALAAFARRTWIARWAFKLLTAVWSLLAGVLGGLMCFAWFTDHEAAKWNENIVELSAVSLLLVVLIPLSWWFPRAVRCTALIVLGLAMLDLLAKVLPWFNQTNAQIIAAVLPIHAAVAWGVYQLPRKLPQPTKAAITA